MPWIDAFCYEVYFGDHLRQKEEAERKAKAEKEEQERIEREKARKREEDFKNAMPLNQYRKHDRCDDERYIRDRIEHLKRSRHHLQCEEEKLMRLLEERRHRR